MVGEDEGGWRDESRMIGRVKVMNGGGAEWGIDQAAPEVSGQ